MTSNSAIALRWVDVALSRTTKSNFKEGRSNVIARGDRIFSYGSHFEMARLIRDTKGNPQRFLINGERFSSTTSQHQSVVRSAIAGSGLPSAIIPHEALRSSGIDFDSLEFIDVSNDRNEEIKHRSHEMPARAEWRTYKATHELRIGWHPVDITLDEDNRPVYSWTTHRHWLGESLVRGKIRWTTRPTCRTCKGEGLVGITLTEYNDQMAAIDHDTTLGWSQLTDRRQAHVERFGCKTCNRMGTVVRNNSRTAYFLSGFDHHESRPLFFLCELPRGVHPTTIAEAYEDLKPDTVKVAEQMGRDVKRQGDIFAVELVGATKRSLRQAGARFEKRGNLLNTNHVATEVAYLPNGTTLVRGTLHHVPEGREPDHKRVTVGKSWHIAIKNSVPIAA